MKNRILALRLLRAMCLCSTVAFVLVPSNIVVAQITSAAITGVLRDAAGVPVPNVTVTAVHQPTGTTYTATTTESGRYNFRNVIVGGPYVVGSQIPGGPAVESQNLVAQLGVEVQANLAPSAESEIVTLETLEVVAATNDLDARAAGASSVLTSAAIDARPTSERSFADLISASPLVTRRSVSGDREEGQITAVGQNNRYNSIQIDGSRINDQFGLNGTGLASFFNPISTEWIEQIAIQVSPYDVRQAGFTGASVNAVTKTGGNTFSGGAYYFFQGDALFDDLQLRGENVRERVGTGRKIVPKLERETRGLYVGGPIIPDRLFFFAGVEKFETLSAGRDPTFINPNFDVILARLNQYSTASGRAIDWGSQVTGQTTNFSEDEKRILKLDWNVTEKHRASVRYLSAEGVVPQFGRFAGTGTFNPNLGGLTATLVDSPSGHFYDQERVEESYVAQFSSQWTPDFKTELRYATTSQDQLTPINTVAPEIYIFNLPGTNATTGAAVTNGAFVAGTEQFRQGNEIYVDTDQYSAIGDYMLGDFVLTAGFEREDSEFENLFRESSYGRFTFPNLAAFLADAPSASDRRFYDPALRPVSDISEFATNGLFFQGRWDATSRLSLTAGLRYEWNEQPIEPVFNQSFLTTTGFRNDGTLDGADYVSPRLSFNYAFDDERVTQIRGGAGHFTGRAPWVFFSNSYANPGVGAFSTTGLGSLTNYLTTQFDPANPIGTGTDTGVQRREINWVDQDTELPSVWRMNLGVDRKIDFLSTIATVEVVQTYSDQALFISNENLRRTTVGADGRQRFAGSPGTTANALYPQYTDLYRVRNVSEGESRYITLGWERPVKDRWGFSLAYVYGDAEDAQAIGQTTASGQWQRNVVFNQSAVEVGTSDFEIRDRVIASLTREFEFRKGWTTRTTLLYEGRSGNPYSYVYNTDINGDGRNDNDLVAIPSGASDPRFNFSGLSSAQLDTYLSNFRAAGLGNGGGIAKRNGFEEPWVNRLDLKFTQRIPIHKPVDLELFFDFINFGSFLSEDVFGYTEVAPQRSNDVFRRRTIGGATYGSDGRIVVMPANVAAAAPFELDNAQSRWRIQLGAKVSF